MNITEISTVLFMGIQGSGKGTQARLLHQYLKEESAHESLHFESGKAIRQFADRDNMTAQKMRTMVDRGEILPVFIPIYFWSQALVDHLRENTHLLIDGTPRMQVEAEILDGAMEFYERELDVIVLDVSKEEARKRLKKRGRADDKAASIEERFNWYEEETVPAIEFFREHERYTIHEIDGEGEIERIHQDIVDVLNL